MNKLSTGQPANLRSYKAIALLLFGEDSGAVKYLDELIQQSPNGDEEEVIQEESQMVYLLGRLHIDGYEKEESK